MKSLLASRSMCLVALLFIFAGCGSGGSNGTPPSGQRLSVNLVADPPVGDGPHQVVLEARVTNPTSGGLTYAWDFGDGSVETGERSVLHTFKTDGAFTTKVTVSNGIETATASATITVKALPQQSAVIGPEGGTVKLDTCEVIVPAGLNPQVAPFALTTLPSFGDLITGQLDPARFKPIGSAYRLETPVKTGVPFTVRLSYADGDLPSGFAAKDLSIIIRGVGFPDVLEDDEVTPGWGGPAVSYTALPATVHTDTHTAEFNAYMRGTFQLVAISGPLDWSQAELLRTVRADSSPSSLLSGQKGAAIDIPLTIVVFNKEPADKVAYKNAALEGFTTAYQYYKGAGFPVPAGPFTIVVGEMGGLGAVNVDYPLIIKMKYTIDSADKIKKTMAHELFHCIQHYFSNKPSRDYSHGAESWFIEGTACWGSDEVYDDIPDLYHATTWERLQTPLNLEGRKAAKYYQTSGFWKWVNSKQSDAIKDTLWTVWTDTHTITQGQVLWIMENSTEVHYQDTFLSVWSGYDPNEPKPDFLKFAMDACYFKDFDVNETKADELWSNYPYLGQPKVVYTEKGKLTTLQSGKPGSSKVDPAEITYGLTQYLTIDIRVIDTLDLAGTLHVKFAETGPGTTYDAAVIVHRGDTEAKIEIVRDLSKPHAEITAPFKPGDEAVIIVADPRWLTTPHNPGFGMVQAWIETACGSLPGQITDVSTTDQLIAALKTVAPGNTIRLAPGSYQPALSTWPLAGWPNQLAGLLVKDITLTGSGSNPEDTVIVLPSTNPSGYGLPLLTYGTVTLRNLKLIPMGTFCIAGIGGHLAVCSVVTEHNHYGEALYFTPWDAGSHSLKVFNSFLLNYTQTFDGIYLSTSASVGQSSITADIQGTTVSGWDWGAEWTNDPKYGPINVTVDCSGFYGNKGYNAVERVVLGSAYTLVEHCPK